MEDYKTFVQELKNASFEGDILLNEKMSKHTTFKIGGEVPVFLAPKDVDALITALSVLKAQGMPFFVLGGGSNVVFCDSGYRGCVLSLSKLKHISILGQEEDSVFVTCGSGATMAQFVNFCLENELSGAEQFAGLPGSLGGAYYMNARCFDRSASDLFVDAYYIDLETYTEEYISYKAEDWDYKVSPFQKGKKIILQLNLRLEKNKKTKEQLLSDCKHYTEERVSKGHFKYPSAGSVFKNNHDFGAPSGKLIDDAGLKGYQIGQAQIAPFHGNFIINLGGATQKDVKSLVQLTVNTVREKTGFSLEPEIIFVE